MSDNGIGAEKTCRFAIENIGDGQEEEMVDLAATVLKTPQRFSGKAVT